MERIVCPHCGKSFTVAEAKKAKVPVADTEVLLQDEAVKMKAALSEKVQLLRREKEHMTACLEELKQKMTRAAALASAEEAKVWEATEERKLIKEHDVLMERRMCLEAQIADIQARLAEIGGENDD